jgi:hypothetical protein
VAGRAVGLTEKFRRQIPLIFMMHGRVGVTAVAIALAGPLTTGCGEVEPYVQRDPAGPCLQLPSRRAGKGYVATLWRGDMFVGNVDTGGQGRDAALVGATTDNPAANAEARIGQREHRAAVGLIFGQPLGAVAVIGLGALATRHQSDGAVTPYLIGAVAVELAMLFGGIHLESSAYDHAHKAIDIYNANPPPGCGASSPVIGPEAP